MECKKAINNYSMHGEIGNEEVNIVANKAKELCIISLYIPMPFNALKPS